MSDVVGEEPQPADTALATTVAVLSPEKSLERVDAHAKYLFTLVATVGTLLTGFGLLSGNPLIKAEPERLFLPLALVCSSLACAMIAMTPSASDVNIYDLNAVAAYFSDRLRRRGRFILAAGLLFALALLSVLTVFQPTIATPTPAPAQATLLLKQMRGEAKDDLTGVVKIIGLPAKARCKIEAIAIKRGGGSITVFKQESNRQDGGAVTAEFSVPEVGTVTELRLTAVAMAADGSESFNEVVSLLLDPRPTPPKRSK